MRLLMNGSKNSVLSRLRNPEGAQEKAINDVKNAPA
jgi:hypothetical protein